MPAMLSQYATLSLRERQELDAYLTQRVWRKMPCSHSQPWRRLTGVSGRQIDGFICGDGDHLVTDEQIQEGKGGLYLIPASRTPLSQLYALRHQLATSFQSDPSRTLHPPQVYDPNPFGGDPKNLGYSTDYRVGPYYPYQTSHGELWCFAKDLDTFFFDEFEFVLLGNRTNDLSEVIKFRQWRNYRVGKGFIDRNIFSVEGEWYRCLILGVQTSRMN